MNSITPNPTQGELNMNLTTIQGGGSASITSAQIAELLESRHDKVKQSIERLVERGVIAQPPMGDVQEIGGNSRIYTTQVYVFSGDGGERDSIIVVAQLSPEFTAQLVDHWRELKRRIAFAGLPDFTDPAAAAIAWAEQHRAKAEAEAKALALQSAVTEQAPKVAALERFTNHNGTYNLRSAAKVLGLPETRLKNWLLVHEWYYRDHGGRLAAYADRIKSGHLDTVAVEIMRSEGIQVVGQPVMTQKGLALLGVNLARDGLIPKPANAA